jgi:glucan phosphoethanolaminetransferase (alkaline phosphatase superfamily)
MKTNKVLLAFAIVYVIITISFLHNIQKDQSASLGYVFIFPIFWIIGGMILGLLFWFKKVRLQTIANKLLLLFSTPLPLLTVFIIFSNLPSSRLTKSTDEYNKDGHRHREVKYDYAVGHTQRIEYYISRDTVTDDKPFPVKDVWLKDSVWTYYNKDGTIQKTEKYP